MSNGRFTKIASGTRYIDSLLAQGWHILPGTGINLPKHYIEGKGEGQPGAVVDRPSEGEGFGAKPYPDPLPPSATTVDPAVTYRRGPGRPPGAKNKPK